MVNESLSHSFGRALDSVRAHARSIGAHLPSVPFHKHETQQKVSVHDREALSGRWRRVPELSDREGLQRAFELMQTGFLVRRGAGILKHMEIEDTPESFTMVMKAGGILDVREKYLWTGERAMFGRRDKKRGKAVGYVVRDPRRGPCIIAEFDEPNAGKAIDYYTLQDDKLIISSQVIAHGKGTESYTTCYVKER